MALSATVVAEVGWLWRPLAWPRRAQYRHCMWCHWRRNGDAWGALVHSRSYRYAINVTFCITQACTSPAPRLLAHQSCIRHASVGTSIGAYVSATVGAAVGTAVGAAVGASAGASAGAVVGATVGPAHLPSRIHQADSHSDRHRHTPVTQVLPVSQPSDRPSVQWPT